MIRSVLCILLAALALPADAAEGDALTVERVVMVMRHGIRPPTKAQVVPQGVASDPWPSWTVPYGHLTEHGAQALEQLGKFDRVDFARRGLLPATGCPGKGEVLIWSDTDERTIRTGDVMAEAMFPGCKVENGHLPEDSNDPLFHPFESKTPPRTNFADAKAAILKDVGSLEAVRAKNRAALEKLGDVLGCCSVQVCQKAGLPQGCKLVDLPSDIVEKKGDRPDTTGALDIAPGAAQSLMLTYVEGKPMKEVGWGRVSRADLEQLMQLHSMKVELLQKPLYLAARGGTPLAKRMLEAVTAPDGAKMTLLVGHDTNLGDLSGLFGYDWQVASYPANTSPPGSAFGLELLRGPDGKKYVRGFYRSQTMDQMRELTALTVDKPAYTQELAMKGCAKTPCALDDFTAFMSARFHTEK